MKLISEIHNGDGHRGRALARCVQLVIVMMLVLGLGASSVIFLPGPLAARLVRDDALNDATVWKRRILAILQEGSQAFRAGAIAPEDEERLVQFTLASDVFRFKMFTAEGRIFWSSRPGDIGTTTDKPYFSDHVARGQSYYKDATKAASEIEDLELHSTGTTEHGSSPRLVSEIYTPIMVDGRFIGAVEFYQDITDIRAQFHQRIRFTLAIFASLGTLFVSCLIGFLLLTSRRRLKHVRARAQQEKDLMENQMRLTRNVRLLSDLNEWLQSSRSLEELFSMVSAFMSKLLVDCAGTIYVYSNSRDVLDGASSWNGGHLHAHIKPDSCWGLRRGRAYAYGSSEIDFVCEHAEPHDAQPYFCFPILAHGETVGLMHLVKSAHSTDEAFAKTRKLAQMCAEQISLAIANVRMRDQLQHQSIRDPLTNLFNRRHFTEMLRKHMDAAKRSGAPLTLISLDVDHFKKFNDNHGHDAGDMVLRAVGSVLEKSCDGDELPCRVGGEEFIVLLPDYDIAAARERAEDIRLAIERISVRYGSKTLPHVSASLGLACRPAHGTTPQDLIKAADTALYEAKARGRNQTCIAQSESQNEARQKLPAPANEDTPEARTRDNAKPAHGATPSPSDAPAQGPTGEAASARKKPRPDRSAA